MPQRGRTDGFEKKGGDMSKLRTIGVVAASAGLLVLGAGVADAAPAAASVLAVDGSDPIATGCATGAITARSDYGDIGGNIRVFVELRYSPKCKTAWARITTKNIPNCVPGQDYCGSVSVVRNSDGRSYECGTPGGTHSCYTAQVNDNGVTSYATGYVDFGGRTAFATTGSY
jgi:hypothetical protein